MNQLCGKGRFFVYGNSSILVLSRLLCICQPSVRQRFNFRTNESSNGVCGADGEVYGARMCA